MLSKDLRREIVRAERDPFHSLFTGDVLLPEDTLLYDQLGGDIYRYEEIELDCHAGSVLQKRKLAVTGREWIVENPDPEDEGATYATELVIKTLKQFEFDQLCYHLMNAVLCGKSFGELFYDEKEIKVGGEKKDFLVPTEARARSASRFEYRRPKERQGEKRFKNKQVETVHGYELWTLGLGSHLSGEPVPKNRIVPHSWGSKTGNPNGLGLGSKLWWPVRFKREITKFWLIFLDRYSQPTPWGTYPNDGSKEELEEFLDSLSQGSWAALPDGYKIELLEATRSSSTSTYEGFEAWCDEQISKAVLGETLTTTPQASGGSRSATEVHNDVRLEIAKADADLLSGYLQRYLIAPIVRLNLGDKVPIPNVWRVFDVGEDLTALAQRDTSLFQMGFRRTLESVTALYGDGFVDTQAQEAEAAANDPDSLENVLAGMGDEPAEPETLESESEPLEDEIEDEPEAEPTQEIDEPAEDEETPESLAPSGAGQTPNKGEKTASIGRFGTGKTVSIGSFSESPLARYMGGVDVA